MLRSNESLRSCSPVKLSLRSLIAIPLIAQVVVVTSITGWLAHRTGQGAIKELAYKLSDETGEHLQHRLETYTELLPLVTQESLDALNLQQLSPNDLDSWLPYLFRQLQRFPDVIYVYYGHTDGRYVELKRAPDGDWDFTINNDVSEQRVKVYDISDDGSLGTALKTYAYDPRERPWYRAADASGQAQWTGVYDFTDPSPNLGITFVRPYTDAGELQGILGADFTLDAIDTFLERSQTSHSSAMFLMDTNGKILASSEKSSAVQEGVPPSSAQDQQQTLIQTTIDHVLEKLETEGPIQRKQHFNFRIKNANYWVQITPFTEDYGLQWLGISLLPESDFTKQIRANSRNTILLCLLAMVVSSGVSIVIAQWINRPIQKLGLATESFIQGHASQPILPSPIQELNRLIKSFNHLETDLDESRAQLRTYTQQLEVLVEQRTQSLRQSEETFAKAFQASPNAITLSTLADGRYIKVNNRFVELMGIPRENIIGHTSIELNVWVAPQTRAVFQRELENNRLHNQEWTVRKPSGELKKILLSAEIIYFQSNACVLLIANDIGERIIEQEKLRQSEERWQLALQGNNDGIWDWNIAAGEIFYSQRWKAMLGYGDDEISHHRDEWKNRLHPQDKDRVLKSTQNHLEQKTPFFTEEYRLRCKDGQYKWILDRGQALWDAHGNPIRMVGSHTDISERKRNEATIQGQEQFLRSIYDGVEAGIFVIDVLGHQKFRYIDSNAAVERMSGAQRNSLINSTPQELFSPETAVEVIHKYQYCVDCGETLTFEENLLINNKQDWWLTTLTPLQDTQGNTYRIISTTVNITKRKTIEEELAQQVQSEQLLTSISNQVRQSLDTQKTYQTTVDQIGLAFGASRCCLHIYTETPTPKIATVAEYLIPDYGSRWDIEVPLINNPHMRAVLSQDLALVTHDVTEAPLLEPVLPLWTPLQIRSMLTIRTSYQGNPNGVIEVHQCDRKRIWLPWEIDLLESVAAQVGIAIAQARLLEQKSTQREELALKNADLEAAKQTAERASQVKGEFLANMSHELRTPLNAILGFAQIMQRTLKYDPIRFPKEAAEHLQIIQNSGDYLLTLINDVLDMAKIETGHITIKTQPFNLHKLLHSLEVMFQPKAQEKGLVLAIECEPEVPQYIETDEAKLRQILINLMGNAIKFTHTGHVTVRVRGQLQFDVEDTGLGIAPDQRQHLFEAFYQTDAGRQAQSGTGLGLAISKTYVDYLGGVLSVDSALGKGSTFRFNLPVVVINHLDESKPTSSLSVVRLAPDQPSYRILVVEDKWASRTLLVKLLEPVGFDVREAVNGKEAIEIWEEWQPHMIWMDMQMPVMDGYEATQHIRAHIRGQATAIIALTASALESEKQIILSAGCDDFVRKPFQDSIIFDKLHQYLGVRYIYEQEASPAVLASDSLQAATRQQLSQQPAEWLQQLHSASSLADAEWVSQLIDQLPPTHNPLAAALRNLVKGFRCDLIAKLCELSVQRKNF